MANLVSPGSHVSIIDESFSTGSGPGTVPLIFLATGQDKINSAGDGIAAGTTKANAGKLYLVSSQRELLQTYGVPNFNEVGGNSLHGFPLNEFGLLAAHSFLGISNRAYCVRADIDLDELTPSSIAPIAPPVNGTYWLDGNGNDAGLYEYVGSTWEKQPVLMYDGTVDAATGAPLSADLTFDYVMVLGVAEAGAERLENQIWTKGTGASAWVKLDSAQTSDVQFTKIWPTTQSDNATALADGDVWINTNDAEMDVSVYSSASSNYVIAPTPYFADTTEANAFYTNVTAGDLFVRYDSDYENTLITTGANFEILRHNGNQTLKVVSSFDFANGSSNLITAFTIGASPVMSSNASDNLGTAELAAAYFNIQLLSNNVSGLQFVTEGTSLALVSLDGTDISVIDPALPVSASGTTVKITSGTQFIANGIYSNWEELSYSAGNTQPSGSLPEGTLWYDPDFKVDILVKKDGEWEEISGTIFVQADEPAYTVNSVWVDSNDPTGYPVIYRADAGTSSWVKADNSDQTTPSGIIFGDARVEPIADPSAIGSPMPVIAQSETRKSLDADAPDATAYPDGMLLWNTRYSGRVVKEYRVDHTYANGTQIVGDRWTLKSGLDFDGSLITGNDAIKKVVVTAMAASIVSNEDIRAESVFYNLIASPGYPELIDEMVGLNIDRKETAFVIGDTPMTLSPSTTELQAWSSNSRVVPSNGDRGIVTADEYLGVFYPSGLSTNLDGNEVVVPSSHMELRTFAYNDQVAYQWFAPAGLQRGGITNATSVGYIDAEGEYVSVSLNEGQRDTLYTNGVNPIRTIPASGIVNWGQKTRSPAQTSAMSRINVARLINYIRYQLDRMVQPFIFEPNDQQTRGNVKTLMDSFMSDLITLRGITDFVVVCDQSNNTPDRIDRNELWIDIAIVPTKAIEFVYIPVRIKSTGSI